MPTSLHFAPRSPSTSRRPSFRAAIALTGAVLLATFLAVIPGVGDQSASAAVVEECNYDVTGGGTQIDCTVDIQNIFDVATQTGSAVVTTTTCLGAANTALVCDPVVTNYDEVITSVNQCNNSATGGGSTVICRVNVTNTITGVGTPQNATINQCIGSGTGGGTEPTVVCDPLGSTTNATITQCNGSGNGGGGTMRVQCTVGTSTTSALLPVTINQCNGSGNGDGATVTCDAAIDNIMIEPVVVTPPDDDDDDDDDTPPVVDDGGDDDGTDEGTDEGDNDGDNGGGGGAGNGSEAAAAATDELAATGVQTGPGLLITAFALLAGASLLIVSRMRRNADLRS